MRFGSAFLAVIVAASVASSAQVPEIKLPSSPRGTAAIQVGGSWTGPEAERRYTGGS